MSDPFRDDSFSYAYYCGRLQVCVESLLDVIANVIDRADVELTDYERNRIDRSRTTLAEKKATP